MDEKAAKDINKSGSITTPVAKPVGAAVSKKETKKKQVSKSTPPVVEKVDATQQEIDSLRS
jgi:hypothetical protein